MEPFASARIHLLALSAALDEPDSDVESLLRDLGVGCARAASSCLGFSITLIEDGAASTVTLLEAAPIGSRIVTSVTIPLDSVPGVAAGGEITFYATEDGGLVDITADLSYALRLAPAAAKFDLRLPPATPGTRLTGFDRGIRNQALGILIDQGFDLDPARDELDRIARRAHLPPGAAARQVIDASRRRSDTEPPT